MNTDLINASVDVLPYTLSRPLEGYRKHYAEENWHGAMNYMLDFFEISSQFLSLVLLAMIKDSDGAAGDPIITKVLTKIDSKRPLSFGDWCNDILNPLVALSHARFPDCKAITSIAGVISPKKNILMGGKGEASVVKIRNEYKGHSTTRSENIYREVITSLEHRLETYIEALLPLGEFIFYPAFTDNNEEWAHPGHYYIRTTESDRWIDLFPLIFCDSKGFIYIFQTLRDEYPAYISSNEEAVPWSGKCWNSSFDSWMQAMMPSFDIAKELNWDEWMFLMQDNVSSFLKRIYTEKKYNKELFVERDALNGMLKDFMESDAVIFPLLGEAGQGKTNQLCHWTESLTDAGEGVIILSGADFSEVNLENRLKNIFNWNSHKPVSRLIDSIARSAEGKGRTITVFFDAVNECINYPDMENDADGPLMLYRDIVRIFGDSGQKRFKVLFTCRNYTWKNILLPEMSHQNQALFFNPGQEEDSSVRGFSDNEVERAYEIYGELFQMMTPFGNLSRGSVIRMKDPLVLKMACTNFLGKELPASMNEFTSVALFGRMIQDISVSYAGKKQVAILKELSEVILEGYERGNATDSIMMSELQEALHDEASRLHDAAVMIFKKDGFSVAFGELLNKPERPILRMVESEKIQFIYERFLEYLLADAYFKRTSSRNGGRITAKDIIETLDKATSNEVFLGAMRNVLIMDYLAYGKADTLMELASGDGAVFEITSLVTDVMNVMVRENYENEIFHILSSFITHTDPESKDVIEEYNALTKKIESNKADDLTISRHKQLSAVIAPIIRIRSLSAVTLINGIFLSDFHNEGIYENDPYRLLWDLLADPVSEVKNDVCMYAYYVSNKKYTLSHSPLKCNITEQIAGKMYEEISSVPVLMLPVGAKRRKKAITDLEVGTRLNVLLIIDALLSGTDEGRERVRKILGQITGIIRHLTLGFSLVKVLMPFFQIIMRKQLVFQSDYVNNVIEYHTFWDKEVIPRKSENGRWSQEDAVEAMKYIFQHSRPDKAQDFSPMRDKVISAYRTGDSFTYFILERILIITGMCSWEDIGPVMSRFRNGEIDDTEWFDYSQMSLIYVLYQLGMKMDRYPDEAWEMLTEWCADWTRRCRGFFKGRNSHKANPRQLYKRNVMTWYAMVWCARNGDMRDPECRNALLFRQLIDESIDNNDKELLVHLIENISELITDSGYIHTALDLLMQVFRRLDRQEKIDMLDKKADLRYDVTSQDIISLIGKILGTAKNYFPEEVNNFLKKDISGLAFPGIPKYKDELLSYNPGGERLSDLFTHKFGNFLIWSLIHEEAVDEFAYESISLATDSNDSFEWFDKVVRVLFRHLFKVRL